MPRRNNENNPLQWHMHTVSLPEGVTPVVLRRRLIQFIDDGMSLPGAWDVELSYRNPKSRGLLSRDWQTGSFQDVINDSEGWGGFVEIVRAGLVDDLRRMMQKEERMRLQRMQRAVPPPKKRKGRKR